MPDDTYFHWSVQHLRDAFMATCLHPHYGADKLALCVPFPSLSLCVQDRSNVGDCERGAVNVETISRSSEWAYNLSFFVAASKTFNTDPHVKRAIAYDDWKCVLACRVSRVACIVCKMDE